MPNSFNLFFQDPILLSASLVFSATLVLLAWALKTYRNAYVLEEDAPYDGPVAREEEAEVNNGIIEARLLDIGNQLTTVSQRLLDLEKATKEKKTFDDTLPPSTGLPQIEKLIQKLDTIETKLDTSAPGKATLTTEDIDRIETKLDSIRKLLVLLSDSGSPNE